MKHQGTTDLITEQENFGFTPRVTHGSAHDWGDAESSSELRLVTSMCLDIKSVEEIELHRSVGQHTEIGTSVIKRQGNEPSQASLSEGWALHKPKGGAVRFSEKVRQYLTFKFEIGEQSERKEDPGQVSQDMRKAKGEKGERLFSREEWLTKAQI
ncbi:unnamed protein product [Pocillopora meandrina]|uniref:Uncharacterized protein n=1 Tax=Pocillopora meandrina TaxID=46732 RepID=A0AAU9XL10_9CNID|nr:unnamed protein product [Pocillopora meandrina]